MAQPNLTDLLGATMTLARVVADSGNTDKIVKTRYALEKIMFALHYSHRRAMYANLDQPNAAEKFNKSESDAFDDAWVALCEVDSSLGGAG